MTPEPPSRAVISMTPQRSMTDRTAYAMAGVTALACALPATAFWAAGASPVSLLLCAEGVAVLVAAAAGRARGRRGERVTVTPEALVVSVKRSPKRRERELARFQPAWVRVSERKTARAKRELWLTQSGREIRVAGDLTDRELDGLKAELENVLSPFRSLAKGI